MWYPISAAHVVVPAGKQKTDETLKKRAAVGINSRPNLGTYVRSTHVRPRSSNGENIGLGDNVDQHQLRQHCHPSSAFHSSAQTCERSSLPHTTSTETDHQQRITHRFSTTPPCPYKFTRPHHTQANTSKQRLLDNGRHQIAMRSRAHRLAGSWRA